MDTRASDDAAMIRRAGIRTKPLDYGAGYPRGQRVSFGKGWRAMARCSDAGSVREDILLRPPLQIQSRSMLQEIEAGLRHVPSAFSRKHRIEPIA